MKFEEIISSFIMVIVTGLVLVGFTIAWYTNNNLPAVTGIEVMAVEMGAVKVALEAGGKDISELEGDAKYAELGMAEFTNISEDDKGELAPGTYGQVTFYVKPITSAVKSCSIVPMVRISQDGSTWYPVIESVDGSTEDAAGADSEYASGTGSDEASGESGSANGSGETGGESGSVDGSGETGGASGSVDESSEAGGASGSADSEGLDIEILYELANRHIEFYQLTEEGVYQKITSEEPYKLNWTAEDFLGETMPEKTAVIYWKWHYEYPFTAEEEATLSAEVKEGKIDTYDEEDMIIGNNISAMKFYFTFSAQ